MHVSSCDGKKNEIVIDEKQTS